MSRPHEQIPFDELLAEMLCRLSARQDGEIIELLRDIKSQNGKIMASQQDELNAITQLNTATSAIGTSLTTIGANLMAALNAEAAGDVPDSILTATNQAVSQLNAVAASASAMASQGAATPVPVPVPTVAPTTGS